MAHTGNNCVFLIRFRPRLWSQAKALLPAVRQRLADFHKELLTR